MFQLKVKWHHWALSLSSTPICCLSWILYLQSEAIYIYSPIVEVDSVQTAKTITLSFTVKVKLETFGVINSGIQYKVEVNPC